MRAAIQKLNGFFHPFPGMHALGVIGASLALVVGLVFPTDGTSMGPSTTSEIPIQTPALESTEPTSFPPSRTAQTETVGVGDSLSALFQRQSLSNQLLAEITAAEGTKRPISRLKAGQSVDFTYNRGELEEIAVQQSAFHHTVIRRTASGDWAVEDRHREPEIYIDHARGRIDSSLFMAGAEAGLSDNLIMELANIYGNVIDFVYEIRQGDEFTVTYEKRYLDGEFVEYGAILAAEFINNGESFIAVRYTDGEGDTGYFDEQGVSLRKAFLRAPLNFNRISSNFKLARKHPVLGTMRAHRGTDYAAPTGTPIYAAGDGTVTYRAAKGGYGNLVVVRHGNGIETRYAHLSKFGKYRTGQKVKQGQVIGYVGSTGLATGPHLHYEFVVNGVHRNPRTIIEKLPKAKSLPEAEFAAFKGMAAPLIASLAAQRNDAELAFQAAR